MQTVRFLAVFGLLAAGAAGLTLYGWRALHPAPAGPPVLDCPVEIDLGPQEFGGRVVGRFRVDNRGGSELHLTRFGTSCSCAGVEIDQDGEAKRVEELRVPAGGHADLSVRISVAVQPGMPQTVFVNFQTSDPARPDASVRVFIPRVTGGLTAEPSAVVFGDIPVGRPAVMTVRLHANGTASRRVQAVRSLQPERFDVRLVSSEVPGASAQEAYRVVAVIEVAARVDRPGRLDVTIEVELAGEGSDRIAVLGEVVPPVIARPAAFIFPRHAGGKPVYAGRIVLTGRDGAELSVAVEAVPDGLTATVRPDPDTPGQWLLDVAAKPEGRTARTVHIRLRGVTRTGESSGLDIPITVLPENP